LIRDTSCQGGNRNLIFVSTPLKPDKYMRERLDYTTRARQFVGRFPMLSYVLTQINFWVLANIFSGTISHIQTLAMSQMAELPVQNGFGSVILISVIIGVSYGTCLGIADYYLDIRFFRRMPLGKIILLKTLISLIFLTLFFVFLRFVLFGLIIAPTLKKDVVALTESTWKYFFLFCLVFYFVMTIIITFINQVNNKYGPGILLPILMGKYRNPIEEERIFMFMDLKSSTTIAESLGHIKYSSFIRDAFMDINQVLSPYNAQVYQYVGDEIVLSWTIKEGLKNLSCVHFYFACEKQFADKTAYYIKNYGQVPHFKAGLHMGKVTAVEIGEIKRDIAYHGDTLNTAARIQSMCNEYGKKLLVSSFFVEQSKIDSQFSITSLGNILLKGKTSTVGIVSIEMLSDKSSFES
jgi:adenylate cyclase